MTATRSGEVPPPGAGPVATPWTATHQAPTLAGELPRVALGIWPTPLVRAHRLERALGRSPVLVKRDDLAGFGVAGNKTRPLEFLLGEAVARGAEVLVSGGGPGSNFVAAAALAARAVDMACELLISGDIDGPRRHPNLVLAEAAGAELRPTGGAPREAVDELVALRAAELTAAGRPAFGIPRGGSTALGAVGFAVAAAELAAQLAADATPTGRPYRIVLAVGSGGSCAGLLAGLVATGLALPVVAVSVSRPPAEITDRVRELASGCARLLGTPAPDLRDVEFVDARGPGFGIATAPERASAELALRTEGLLLDHTYGAEAFHEAVRRADGGPVLFWHTGGVVPALGTLTGPAGPGRVRERTERGEG